MTVDESFQTLSLATYCRYISAILLKILLQSLKTINIFVKLKK